MSSDPPGRTEKKSEVGSQNSKVKIHYYSELNTPD